MNSTLSTRDVLLLAALHFQQEAITLSELSQNGYLSDGSEVEPQSSNEEDNMLQASLDLIALSMASFLNTGQPRGAYNQYEHSNFFEKALQWPDREFRHIFRLSRITFDRIVALLEEDPRFISRGRKPQRPVYHQFGAFLLRYGVMRSDSLSAALQAAIGHGSVFNYCKRVIRALRKIGLRAISWGDNTRRETVMQAFHDLSGLENCIGIMDGSLIRLDGVPTEWAKVYMCRKKFPAINVQAVVDHQKRFISYEMGWPGSIADVTILKNSGLWKNRASYFSGDEYLLADRGYQSSPYMLRPFTEPEINEFQGPERRRRRQFNKQVSGIRVYVEHAFGLLKGRFPSLKCMGWHDDIEDIYYAVEAMMVIHNLCISWGDEPWLDSDVDYGDNWNAEDMPANELGYGGITIPPEMENRIPGYETSEWHRSEGHRKRQSILDKILPIDMYDD